MMDIGKDVQQAYEEGYKQGRFDESVEGRPTGEWIDGEVRDGDYLVLPIQSCSLCNTFYPLAFTGGGHRFCPNCGADMRGDIE